MSEERNMCLASIIAKMWFKFQFYTRMHRRLVIEPNDIIVFMRFK